MQTKTEKILGLVPEQQIIKERIEVTKLLYYINDGNVKHSLSKSKMASIMGISLVDFLQRYGNFMGKLQDGEEL